MLENNMMSFAFVDFIVGFLMMASMSHIVMSRANISFPSAFGYNSKANLIHGLLAAFIAVGIYFFNYGFSAIISNGLLLGAFDLLLAYALFGRILHNKIQKRVSTIQQA